jgi:hypothetical protein
MITKAKFCATIVDGLEKAGFNIDPSDIEKYHNTRIKPKQIINFMIKALTKQRTERDRDILININYINRAIWLMAEEAL